MSTKKQKAAAPKKLLKSYFLLRKNMKAQRARQAMQAKKATLSANDPADPLRPSATLSANDRNDYVEVEWDENHIDERLGAWFPAGPGGWEGQPLYAPGHHDDAGGQFFGVWTWSDWALWN